MTHTRSRRDARYTAQKYEETLSDLILCEKVNLCDIPFEVRKLTRSLYIYGNRVSRYDIEKKIAFFRLVFEDYSKLLVCERNVLENLIITILEWEKDVIQKYEIEPPKEIRESPWFNSNMEW